MAPQPPSQKPSARTLRHQRITGQIHPLLPSKLFRPTATTSDSFLSTKKDKKLIKSSSFLSRVSSTTTHSNTGNRISKSGHRRNRRPGNKLKANLESLADALPEIEKIDQSQLGKIKHRSLKSRKGALKRKETVVKGEMDRFGASMARLNEMDKGEVGTSGKMVVKADSKEDDGEESNTSEVPQTANRWAALRGYISSTMEQNPAFVNKS